MRYALIIFATALFIAALEAIAFFASQQDFVWFFVVIAGALTASFFAVQLIGGRLLYVPVLILLTLSTIALFYFIDTQMQQQVFIMLSGIVYTSTLYGVARMRDNFRDILGQSLYIVATMIAVFCAFTAIYGIYLNFTIPLWVLMLAYLLVTHAASYPYFYIISGNKNQATLYSGIVAFAMTQLAWAMHFWPFGYLTTGVIGLMFYYILWDFTQSHLMGIISKQRVITNILTFAFLITLLLYFAREQFDILG